MYFVLQINTVTQRAQRKYITKGTKYMLPIKFKQLLRKREAMFVGLAALIPSKIQLNYLEEDERPKSNDISFLSKVGKMVTHFN